MRSFEKSFLSRNLSKYDFFTKTKESARKAGVAGYLGVAVILLLTVLFVLETRRYFVTYETTDTLHVDKHHLEKVSLQFDIEFPNLPCRSVSVDLLDTNGGQFSNINTHVKKHALDTSGSKLHTTVHRNTDANKPKHKSSGVCSKCDDFLPKRDNAKYRKLLIEKRKDKDVIVPKCCNACPRLLLVYKLLGIPSMFALAHAPCRGAMTPPSNDLEKKGVGCRVEGHFRVGKSAGNLHIAAGVSGSQGHGGHGHHIHRINFQTIKDFDVSHKIHKLSFGDQFYGKVEPMQGMEVEESKLSQYIYFVKVVPTRFEYGFGLSIPLHQYSFTSHNEEVKLTRNQFKLPGLFIRYQFDPLAITRTLSGVSFSSYVTRTCALIGGVYVVIGFLARAVNAGVSLAKKND